MHVIAAFKDKLFLYFKDSYFELKHVVWPTQKQLLHHTIIVIVFSIVVAVFLGVLDIFFGIGIKQFILAK